MPLTTEYPRFIPHSRGGVICNRDCDIVFLPECDGRSSDRYAAGTCEDVLLGAVSKTQSYHRVPPPEACTGSVCCLSSLCQPQLEETLLAVGYTDGWLNLVNYITAEPVQVFRAHSSDITIIYLPPPQEDSPSEWLFTGGKDTEITAFHRFKDRGFRLRGHSQPITGLQLIVPGKSALAKSDILLSSDREGLIKFWHLELRHCFKTLSGHPGPVWDMVVNQKQDRLFVGGRDEFIRVWKLRYAQDSVTEIAVAENSREEKRRRQELVQDAKENGTDATLRSFLLSEEQLVEVEFYGSLQRESEKRVQKLRMAGDLLLCQTLEKQVQLFQCLTDEAKIKKLLLKKSKKAKLLAAQAKPGEVQSQSETAVNVFDVELQAITSKLSFPSQVRAIDVMLYRTKTTIEPTYRILTSHALNLVTLSEIEVRNPRTVKIRELHRATEQGFRQPPIACCFLHNDMTICAMDSAGTIKLFASDFTSYRFSSVVLQKESDTTLDKAICFLVIHTNDHCAIGYQSGMLRVVHLRTGAVQWETAAHSKRMNSICCTHTKRLIITGGNDKRLCTWRQTRSVLDKAMALFNLSLVMQGECVLKHEVLVVQSSPNEKYILAALADNSVEVLFLDSFKPAYHLYGFHMPVECMAVSSDSQILATGSQDRIIRIWSLQHGTMERMLEKAATGRITSLAFLPNSPLLFSSDSTGLVRQWNAQKFHLILTLEGHKAECHCLSVSHNGKQVVSCGQDYSMRVWAQSEVDVVVLEDEAIERQMRLEERERLCHEELVMPGVDSEQAAVGVLAKKTANTLRAEEFLRESLDLLYANEQTSRGGGTTEEDSGLAQHPLLMAHQCADFEELVLVALVRIRRPELELCIASLPWLPHSYRLLCLLPKLLRRCPWRCSLWVEVATVLTHVHAEALLSGAANVPAEYRLFEDEGDTEDEDDEDESLGDNASPLVRLLQRFRRHAECELEREKKIVGFNMSACEYGKVVSLDNFDVPF